MASYVWFLVTGFAAGISSGFFGIGGGIIVIVVLTLLMHVPQGRANGISLVALLLPVGILGVVEYYRAGRIGPGDIRSGLLIAGDMFVGTLVGSRIAVGLPEALLRKSFACFLILVALRMLFSK